MSQGHWLVIRQRVAKADTRFIVMIVGSTSVVWGKEISKENSSAV